MSKLSVYLTASCILVALLSLVASPAGAQVVAQSAATEDAGKPEQVVVTASRRREKVQSVPATITVLGTRQLQALNASSQEDYLGQIPGITTFGTAQGDQQIILRGITSSGNQQSATVGTYIDDVAIGSSTADAVGARAKPDLNVFDLSRIEVLKGPQGTLYGPTRWAAC